MLPAAASPAPGSEGSGPPTFFGTVPEISANPRSFCKGGGLFYFFIDNIIRFSSLIINVKCSQKIIFSKKLLKKLYSKPIGLGLGLLRETGPCSSSLYRTCSLYSANK